MAKSIKIFVFIILTSSVQLLASHYMGGEITWQCLSNGHYRFIMKLYRDCSGITYNTTESLKVSGCPSVTSITMTLRPGANPHDIDDGSLDGLTDLTPDCYSGTYQIHCNPEPSNPNTGAIQEWYFTSDGNYPNGVVLNGVPPVSGWVFSDSSCCRNPSSNILSPTGTSWFLRAVMYPYNGTNANPCYDSSPVFAETPPTISCTGSMVNFNYNSNDVDYDSLSYAWTPALNGDISTPVTYMGNYTYNSPLPGPVQYSLNIPAVLNQNSGEVTFKSYTSGSFVTAVKTSEYRCGILIGEVINEMQVILTGNCPSVPPLVITSPFYNPLTGLYGFIDTVYAGDTVDFDLSATNSGTLPNGNPVSITLEASGKDFGAGYTNPNSGCDNPPCATLNPPPLITAPSSVTTHFHWQTSCSTAQGVCGLHNNIHNFIIKYANNYCPIPGQYIAMVTIVVLPPKIDPPDVTNSEILPNGDVTLSWIPPLDSLGYFDSYYVFYSANPNGPFVEIDSIFSYSVSFKTYSGLGTITSPKYFYIKTRASCNNYSVSSDTIAGRLKFDAGITGIIDPNSQLYQGNSQIVKVILRNFGLDTLNSINIKYWVNGISQSTETWSGFLLPNATDTFSFFQPFIVPVIGPFSFCSSTSNIQDLNITNDELCLNLNCNIQYDAGIIEILSPASSPIQGNSDEVKVVMKNFGHDTLTSVDLMYSVNSLINSTENWSGVLLPNETDTFTFFQNLTIPVGDFDICSFPSILLNSDITNDTLCETLSSILGINDYTYSGFELKQNVPNPYSDKTSIVYYVPENAIVRFEVDDILGQGIISMEKFAKKGRNQIELDASKLNNGIYFYSVIFQRQKLVKRMVIAR